LGIVEYLDEQMHDSLHGTDLVFCRQVPVLWILLHTMGYLQPHRKPRLLPLDDGRKKMAVETKMINCKCKTIHKRTFNY
jgi:hypothetical protein